MSTATDTRTAVRREVTTCTDCGASAAGRYSTLQLCDPCGDAPAKREPRAPRCERLAEQGRRQLLEEVYDGLLEIDEDRWEGCQVVDVESEGHVRSETFTAEVIVTDDDGETVVRTVHLVKRHDVDPDAPVWEEQTRFQAIDYVGGGP